MSRRVFVFALGIITSLAILEIGLRILGSTGSSLRRAPSPVGSSFSIVCLGNSYTAGTGAPLGQSYCDQLRTRIESDPKAGGVHVNTVNLGTPNANTTMVLGQLAAFLKSARPDLVLLMTGEPNEWNLFGFGRRASTEPWGERAYDLAYHSRLFRFATLVAARFDRQARKPADPGRRSVEFPETPLSDIPTLGYKYMGLMVTPVTLHPEQMSAEAFAEALEVLKAFSDSDAGRKPAVFRILGSLLLSRGRWAEAADWFERSMALNNGVFSYDVASAIQEFLDRHAGQSFPALEDSLRHARKPCPTEAGYIRARDAILVDPPPGRLSKVDLSLWVERLSFAHRLSPEANKVTMNLAWVYHLSGDDKKALGTLIEGFQLNPFGVPDILASLSEAERMFPDEVTHRRIDAALQEFRARFPNDAYRTDATDRRRIAEWIRSDIISMARLLKSSDVPFILQAYPPTRDGIRRVADDVLPELAKEEGYPFSDTRSLFLGAFPTPLEREPFYSNQFGKSDDHLNARGYGLIADLLWKTIRERGYLHQPN